LLEDLGFVLEHSFPEGYVRLIHPELILEFLVPEAGRGTSKPYPLTELSVNAQRLRFLGLLESDTIVVDFSGLKVKIPHPVNFGLHKILVSSRRTDPDKKAKDIKAGLEVLRMCVENQDGPRIVDLFGTVSKKQRKRILKSLEASEAEDLIELMPGRRTGKGETLVL